ncbi:MAG: NAD-dependent DNA ligase LigA [Eubacteriales bacterium]|nr:NAD-dependent DNA ligase LigA [Eubacteriales bacterium]
MDQQMKMRELVQRLNQAAKAYYTDNIEIMSNLEYDRLYDELEELERQTGIVLAGSPTQRVGYDVVENLPKVEHVRPMLSLNKTKSVEELTAFAGAQPVLLSWKLDGLTVVLRYQDGQLVQAVTRGTGTIGEEITGNARVFEQLPLQIPFRGSLTLRGEAVIRYDDFEKINASIPLIENRYKNPRNLCSGSVRQLDSRIAAARHIHWLAFGLVSVDGGMEGALKDEISSSRYSQLQWLQKLGFETVEAHFCTADEVAEKVAYFQKQISQYPIPSDGLVCEYDDIAYGESLGSTNKFPRNAIAFKWQDETAETVLRDIEWSASRTGSINPVAIFDPVELEGTSVSRASVHNISMVRQLKLGIGDRIKVYKANMIIPQISENLTGSDDVDIPQQCPVCSAATEFEKTNDTEVLICPNPSCLAKRIKLLTHFVSRNAMNIDGLSEATLEKLVGAGLLHRLSDIFHLDQYRETICRLEGLGEKSWSRLAQGIERSRHVKPAALLYGLGIDGIGQAMAKQVMLFCEGSFERLQEAETAQLSSIEGVGEVLAASITAYFKDEDHKEEIKRLLSELELDLADYRLRETDELSLKGLTFVITGSLSRYPNREALKDEIERLGGKVSGSVSAKTAYLINNDVLSTSGKNKKAKELGVPIISEEEFIYSFLQGNHV